jgi:hypothetical protein
MNAVATTTYHVTAVIYGRKLFMASVTDILHAKALESSGARTIKIFTMGRNFGTRSNIRAVIYNLRLYPKYQHYTVLVNWGPNKLECLFSQAFFAKCTVTLYLNRPNMLESLSMASFSSLV